MNKTRKNLTIQRVASPDLAAVRSWLARQRAWEDRLAELEREDRLPVPSPSPVAALSA